MELDEMHGNNLWKLDPEAPKYYDAKGIQQRLRRLRRARTKGDMDLLLHLLPELLAVATLAKRCSRAATVSLDMACVFPLPVWP